MAENKKIKNATAKMYNGIKFRSLLEVSVYKILLQEGFKPDYELNPIHLVDGFVPTIPFLTKNKFKRKNHNIKVISNNTVIDKRPLDSWVYTPDFYFEYNDTKVFIEVKGFANDLWSYKCKMFRKHLENYEDKEHYQIWEIHNKKQLLECIILLKNGNCI